MFQINYIREELHTLQASTPTTVVTSAVKSGQCSAARLWLLYIYICSALSILWVLHLLVMVYPIQTWKFTNFPQQLAPFHCIYMWIRGD
jgi:hypothetical protein